MLFWFLYANRRTDKLISIDAPHECEDALTGEGKGVLRQTEVTKGVPVG
jgi:hypothetical protein